MLLSFRGTISAFTILMFVSIVQLLYLAFYPSTFATQLNRQQYQQDIQFFVDVIKQRSAFAVLSPQDLQRIETESQKLTRSAGKQTSAAALEQQLQQLISKLNDPAASVSLISSTQTAVTLPLALRFDGEHWQAFSNKKKLLAEDLPYLTHIDGIPMNRWVKAAQVYLANPLKQSAQAQTDWLQHITKLRQDIGLAANKKVVLTLSNGEVSEQHTLTLAHESSDTGGLQPFTASTPSHSIANSEHHLLRFEDELDSATIKQLSHLLAQKELYSQQESRSPLTLDIRAIKSPQPQLMALLQSHFGQANQSTSIGLLRYKRFATSRAEHIANQYFSIAELSFFEQSRLLNHGFNNALNQNSALSDFLVRQHQSSPNSAEISQQKLTLLIDSSCELECEWIALASLNWPNVELIGETTRGSLSPRYYATLPNSGIQLQFSQGIVYSPSGQLISGIGLAPAMQLNHLAFEDEQVVALIAAQKLTRSLAPLKGTVAIATLEKR